MQTLQTTHQAIENITLNGRISRIAIGAVMLLPVFTSSGPAAAQAVIALLAIFPIMSGLNAFCPLVSWMRSLRGEQISNSLSLLSRSIYAVSAVGLVGSVFIVQGQALGYWAILPLLGIYPALSAIYGADLFSGVIRSFRLKQSEPVASAEILSWSTDKAEQPHQEVDHAA